MKAIRIINDKEVEFEMPIYESLISIGDIMYNYDGYRTTKGLKALIDECRGYVYDEAYRYKREKIKEKIKQNAMIMLALVNIILGIMIGICL